jgi:hypothetical protein
MAATISQGNSEGINPSELVGGISPLMGRDPTCSATSAGAPFTLMRLLHQLRQRSERLASPMRSRLLSLDNAGMRGRHVPSLNLMPFNLTESRIAPPSGTRTVLLPRHVLRPELVVEALWKGEP